MIVYLLLHEPTEMGYVGSTEGPVEERFQSHWAERKRSKAPLYRAMSFSRKDEWLRVALEEYHDLESMLWGEVEWMLKLETVHPKVGFNCQLPSAQSIEQALRRKELKAARRREDMSPEELEAFRLAGLKGAAALDAKLSHEQRVSNGLKGAAAKWSKAGERERMRAAAHGKPNTWWGSLTEEQREEHRRRGREAGKNNKNGGASPGRPAKGSSTGT